MTGPVAGSHWRGDHTPGDAVMSPAVYSGLHKALHQVQTIEKELADLPACCTALLSF